MISSVALPLILKYRDKIAQKPIPQKTLASEELQYKFLYYSFVALKSICEHSEDVVRVFNNLYITTSWINTFAIGLLAKPYLPQLVDQAKVGFSKISFDVNFGSPREFFQSLVSKTPEIGKIRGVVEVLSLMVESYNWMGDNRDVTEEKLFLTSLSKIIQIAACLGTIPQLASYKAYVPAVIGATLVAGYASVTEKNRENKSVVNISRIIAHPLNLFVKTVNSIAVGVLINKSFKNPSQNKLIMGIAATFALSSYNMFKDWYKGW